MYCVWLVLLIGGGSTAKSRPWCFIEQVYVAQTKLKQQCHNFCAKIIYINVKCDATLDNVSLKVTSQMLEAQCNTKGKLLETAQLQHFVQRRFVSNTF